MPPVTRKSSSRFHRPTVTHLPDHLPLGEVLSNARALTIADKIISRSNLDELVFVYDTSRTGQKRKMSFRQVLVVILAFKVQGPKKDTTFADVARWGHDTFTAAHWRQLGMPDGFTYAQLQASFKALCELLEPEDSFHRVDLSTGEFLRPRRANLMSLDEVANRILDASIPAAIPAPEVLALDSTDIETHAARRGWPDKPDVEHADEMLPGDDAEPEKPHYDADWPKTGPDGRAVTSADPDARLGWRTRKNQSSSSIFNGYDLHLLVDGGTVGKPSQPYFIRGMILRPAGSYKLEAGLAALTTLPGGFPGKCLVSDRGYSQGLPENWHFKLQDLGIEYAHDLRKNQRKPRISSKRGTFWLDGELYVDALPEKYRDLSNYSIGMKRADQDELRAMYDARIPYAFAPNTKVRPDGSVQLKGPARAGKVSCPNYPKSREDVVPTNCIAGQPCACGSTIVIKRDEAARERQLHPFGSTRWCEVYGMRSAVESDNAQLKAWRGSVRRHSTYVFGTTANTLLLALQCAAVNISMLHDAYDGKVTINATDRRHVPAKRHRKPVNQALHLQGRRRRATAPAR